jgi:hypothetical protein
LFGPRSNSSLLLLIFAPVGYGFVSSFPCCHFFKVELGRGAVSDIFISWCFKSAKKSAVHVSFLFPIGLGQPRDDALVYFFFSFGGCCGLFLVWEWLNDDRVASVMLHGLLIVFFLL